MCYFFSICYGFSNPIWLHGYVRESQILMRLTGQCLLQLHLTMLIARAPQTEIPQNALQPKQSRVFCDTLDFRNNFSSGLTAALVLIYSAGLLELHTNTHTEHSYSTSHKRQSGSTGRRKQSYTLLLTVQPPVILHWTLDKCLASCCSNFYRAHLAVASRAFEPLTHFFMDIKR